jgi:hypothetical protein
MLPEVDTAVLEKSFTELELYETVFGSEPFGVPGPDGVILLFYFISIFGL